GLALGKLNGFNGAGEHRLQRACGGLGSLASLDSRVDELAWADSAPLAAGVDLELALLHRRARRAVCRGGLESEPRDGDRAGPLESERRGLRLRPVEKACQVEPRAGGAAPHEGGKGD